MHHDPQQQFQALVTSAVTALLRLPDDERAALLTEMRVVVFKRAAETYGLAAGQRFADAFANEVGRRVQQADDPASA